MNKPESVIVEEAVVEIRNFINDISKKYGLSYFILRVILNDFCKIVEESEKKQNEEYRKCLKEQELIKESNKGGK